MPPQKKNESYMTPAANIIHNTLSTFSQKIKSGILCSIYSKRTPLSFTLPCIMEKRVAIYTRRRRQQYASKMYLNLQSDSSKQLQRSSRVNTRPVDSLSRIYIYVYSRRHFLTPFALSFSLSLTLVLLRGRVLSREKRCCWWKKV